MDAERFEDFITVDYRNSSGVYAQMVRELGSSSTKCVFTHGDLRPANIMVDTGHWRVSSIVDWEASGFLPGILGIRQKDKQLNAER